MRKGAGWIAAACCLWGVSLGAVQGAEGGRPNVVVVMADDFGYECVTANGGESYQTPNLDRLAAGGVRFENCHVQPLCTPTRVQLMTGRYNVRNYIRFGELDVKAVTFGRLFQDAGYATGIVGKWQLGRDEKLPQHFGFAESYLWQHTRRPPRYANPGLERNGVEEDFKNGEYGPDLLQKEALAFIDRSAEKGKPFFLYYPLTLTHSPFQPTPDSAAWDPKAQGEKVNDKPKHFAAMTAYTDKLVGGLLDHLEKNKLREKTLVLFIGDNGTGKPITSKFKGADYRGGKGTSTVRGTHVPLLVSLPGTFPAGKVLPDLVDSTDVLPTIAAFAGVSTSPAGELDGRSFLPQLKGEIGKPREWIYSWYAPDGGGKPDHEFAMNARSKLYSDGRFFDLSADPYEQRPARSAGELTGAAKEDAAMLQTAIDRFKDARPPHLANAKKSKVVAPE